MTFSLLLPLLSSVLSSLFKKLVRDRVEAAKCIGDVGFTISLLLIIQQVYYPPPPPPQENIYIRIALLSPGTTVIPRKMTAILIQNFGF